MTHQYMSTTFRFRTLKAASTRDKKTKTRRFKKDIRTCLKSQVFNSCILPAMKRGAETWTLTTQAKNKLAAVQTNMERS